MSLNSDALTTVADAVSYITGKVPQADQSDGGKVERLINAYSRAIRNYTLREFKPKTPAADSDQPVTRRFRYDGEGSVSFAPYELRSLGGGGYGGTGAVTLYSDFPGASQRVLTQLTSLVQAQFRLGPRQQTPDGTYLWISLPSLKGPRAGANMIGIEQMPTSQLVEGFPIPPVYFEIEVSVSGYWGVGAAPADVELACLIAVANQYRDPEGFATRQIGDLSFSEVAEVGDVVGRSLPPDARALLGPYRRKNAGRVVV